MPTLTYTEVVEMVTISCYKCGVVFGVPKDFNDTRLRKQDDFWCPAGHPQRYLGETAADKMRRERDIAQQHLARAHEETAAALRRAKRAEATSAKITKRANAGLCPCCNRSFANVARHMKNKHKDVIPLQARKLP